MMKHILPLSVGILVIILLILFAIQNMMTARTPKNTVYATPTPVESRRNLGGRTPQNKLTPMVYPTTEVQTFRRSLPILTPDFTVDYSDRMDKYVVNIQTENGEISYVEWLEANPEYQGVLTEQQTIIAHQSIKELHEALDYANTIKKDPVQKAKDDARIFNNSINTLINLPFTLFNSFSSSATQNTNSTPMPTDRPQTRNKAKKPSTTPAPLASGKGYVYYSQCSGPYDSIPLPDGCNVCAAGCGPTSIAMILSSYVDSSLTPPKTIQELDKNGVRMGCYGSYISELYNYLRGRKDLKVSDFIIPSEQKLQAKDVADDFRGYIKNGWTIFVLANFKTDGGGHYFWVTNVTDSNEILAYDPYYGKQQPAPFNENKYSPAPYYRYAFAIKKA